MMLGQEGTDPSGSLSGVSVVEAFREAMSHLAAAVFMVTTRVDDKPWGLTISACCSVSLAPPMLLVCLGNETVSARSIAVERNFGVSILGERSLPAARFGSAKGVPKFVEQFCDLDDDVVKSCETPVLAGALAHVDCELDQAIAAGDHTVFLGRVRSVLLSPKDAPLLYYARRYQRLGTWSDEHPYQGW